VLISGQKLKEKLSGRYSYLRNWFNELPGAQNRARGRIMNLRDASS
jgi:hypothetical protein